MSAANRETEDHHREQRPQQTQGRNLNPGIRRPQLSEDLLGKAVLILAAWLLAACTEGAPDIDVARAYDLGSVIKGDLAVADFPVRNLGDGPLTVAAVSTSCGCTKATLTPMTIAPGAEARLRIEYDSAAHEEDLGLIERFVFVSSDDPDEDDVQIKFTVLVEAKSM